MISKQTSLQTGFTLIELMIVVGIMAIIAAIAIPAYNGYQKNAYLTECSNEVNILKMAQQEFFLENNAYFPSPAATLDTGSGATFVQIQTASGNIYQSSYDTASATAETDANCTYRIISTTGPDGFSITATGQNNLTTNETFTQTN